MKRILLSLLVFAFAFASVSWADEIGGIWELESKGMIAPGADPQELEEANKALNDMDDVPTFLTARSDGTMVQTYIFEDAVDARIGEWYKYAPDKYIFIHSFSTLSGDTKNHIYYLEIKDDVLIFEISNEDNIQVVDYFHKIEEE